MKWARTAFESINAISGERCCPHPHNFTDRLIRSRRPGLLRHHPVVHGLSHLLLPHLQRRARVPAAGHRLPAAREWMDRAIELIRPGVTTDKSRRRPELRRDRLRDRDGGLRPEFLPRPGARPARTAHHSRLTSLDDPMELTAGMVFRGGNLLSREPTAYRRHGSRRKSSLRRAARRSSACSPRRKLPIANRY